jgi:hypothetical protein
LLLVVWRLDAIAGVNDDDLAVTTMTQAKIRQDPDIIILIDFEANKCPVVATLVVPLAEKTIPDREISRYRSSD